MGCYKNKQNGLGNKPVEALEFHASHTDDKCKKLGEEKEFLDCWEYIDKSEHAPNKL